MVKAKGRALRTGGGRVSGYSYRGNGYTEEGVVIGGGRVVRARRESGCICRENGYNWVESIAPVGRRGGEGGEGGVLLEREWL